MSNRESFKSVGRWHAELTEKGSRNLQVIVLGNKVDLEGSRAVTREEGEEWAKEHGVGFMEVSAKVPQGIERPFIEMSRQVLRKIETKAIDVREELGIKATEDPKEGKKERKTQGRELAQRRRKSCWEELCGS